MPDETHVADRRRIAAQMERDRRLQALAALSGSLEEQHDEQATMTTRDERYAKMELWGSSYNRTWAPKWCTCMQTQHKVQLDECDANPAIVVAPYSAPAPQATHGGSYLPQYVLYVASPCATPPPHAVMYAPLHPQAPDVARSNNNMAATCASTCTTQTPLQRLPNATRRPLAQAPSATVQQAVQQMERQQQQQPDGPAVAATGSRRSAILRLALLTAAGSLPLLLPVRGTMVGPRSELLLDSQLLPMPPGPIAFPRRQVDLNFAVLLMRSAYEACDDLNFVAMDEFQKRFWKLRQAEWESYLLLHSPLRIQQGQLSDPLYFDFIAYSQAAAASNLMREGKQVFEEYEEESEGKRMVTRDPSLADNALLPGLLFERHGELMYRRLVEGFRGEQYGGPLPSPPDASQEQLLVGVQQVLDIFSAKGYALKATLKPNPGCGGGGGGGGGGGSCAFTVRLQGPANLWSLQALAARRSLVYPQHDAAVVAAFLRASSRSSTCRLIWTDTGVRQEWSLA